MSNDNKIRVWEIPERGIEEDLAEPKSVLGGKIYSFFALGNESSHLKTYKLDPWIKYI